MYIMTWRTPILTLSLVLAATVVYGQGASTPENSRRACTDGADNDGDGLIDCGDQDCAVLVFCAEQQAELEETPEACQDGRDNDRDNFADCADQDCQDFTFCAGAIPTAPTTSQPVQPAQPTQPMSQPTQPGAQPVITDAPPPTTGNFRVVTHAIPAEVTSTPPGATVAVDGIEVGQTPWRGDIPAGRPTVTIASEGFRTVELRPRISTTEDETVTISSNLPPPEGFNYRFFTLQVGLQPMGVTMGDYSDTSEGGVYFLERFLFTPARPRLGERREMLLDLGFELGFGHFFDNIYRDWDGGDCSHEPDESCQFIALDGTRMAFDDSDLESFHGFQFGAVLNMSFPIAVRGTRPILTLNLSTTLGFSVLEEIAFRLNLTTGLSIFISDFVEMRLDLVSFSMYTYGTDMCRCIRGSSGDCDWVDSSQTLVLAHYTPAILIGFRFH